MCYGTCHVLQPIARSTNKELDQWQAASMSTDLLRLLQRSLAMRPAAHTQLINCLGSTPQTVTRRM